MNSESPEIDLLKEFEEYLKQADLDNLTTNDQPDLNTLLTEITRLKTEVKAESRQFKNTLESLDASLTKTQEENRVLVEQLAAAEQRLQVQKQEVVKTMLLELLDLHDRLSSGVKMLENYRPVKTLFKSSRKKDIRLIKRFKEGQSMTVRRIDQLLWQYKVRPIDSVGEIFDPTKMQAIETAHVANQEPGIVLEELRKGFMFQGQVLRLAEVKVNKIR